MQTVDFYFDYLSPFSYFAWLKRKEINAQLNFKPTPLGPLLNHWGIKGPGEVTPKREFLLKQCMRKAARENIQFITPKTHPFNSLYALRLSIKEVAGDLQEQVIDCLWKAGWQERIDMGEPEELLAVLRRANLPADELYEKSFSPTAKKVIKAHISEATAAGVFGVPSFVAQGELFWGADSFKELNEYLAGKDLLDRTKFNSLIAETPRGAP